MNDARVSAHVLAPGVPGGPLVVFAHGLEDAWTSWSAVARELDPRWRLVALDLPWRPGNDYRWRDRPSGRWLAEGLGLVGARPDVLVAHSFGSGAALELLCEPGAPTPGAAVLMICPVFRLPDRPLSWWMFDRARARFEESIRDGVRARMTGRAAAPAPDVLEKMMDLALERVGPAGFLTVFEQFVASGDLSLDRVRLPVLVLAGGSDPTLSPRAAQVLADAMPRAGLRVDDAYDHFCHVRHAAGVAGHVSGLVESVSVPSRTVERTP